MKTSLQLKLGQQLAMTPQLQQAIRLLQLSSLELQQEIQLALESNPLLEQEDLTHELENEVGANLLDQTLAGFDAPTENGGELNSTELLAQQTIPDELPVDTTWDEAYSASTESYAHGLDDEFPIYQGETTQTLQDHLLWQLRLTPFSEIDRAIATAIIDAVDEKGYLTLSTQEILESLGLADVELDEVEAVLKRVQQFDPLSVASRNLQECLLLQLSAL
ncbi:MAG: RNA polymerase factor sigma-54, partial [Vibrionaceae bacterium]